MHMFVKLLVHLGKLSICYCLIMVFALDALEEFLRSEDIPALLF